MRSNIHAGGVKAAAKVDSTALKIAEIVRPRLVQDGMFLVGLTVLPIAWLIAWMVSTETALALGWTLKTTLLPAATQPMVLLMIVTVGLVVGVIAATTP